MRLAALSFLPLFLRLLLAGEHDQDSMLGILPPTQFRSAALPSLHHVDRHLFTQACGQGLDPDLLCGGDAKLLDQGEEITHDPC
jgi:hypothetical protein